MDSPIPTEALHHLSGSVKCHHNLLNMQLLLFFGSDLTERSKIDFESFVVDGFTPFPLDFSAVKFCVDKELKYLEIDDFINEYEMRTVLQDAVQLGKTWCRDEWEDLSSQGICWPDFDRWFMAFFWQEVAIASALVDKFKIHKINKIIICFSETRRHGKSSDASDVFSSCIEKMLFQSAIEVLPYILPEKATIEPAFPSLNNMVFRIGDFFRKIDWICKYRRVYKRNIIFACHSEDIYRYSYAFENLSVDVRKQIVITTTQSTINKAQRMLAKRLGLAIISHPLIYPEHFDPLLVKKFSRAVEKIVDKSKKENSILHKVLHSYVLDYLVNQRWPKLSASYTFWLKLVKEINPCCVLVNSLPGSEWQLPAVAGNSIKVPTFSMPHAEAPVKEALDFYDLNHAKFILCSTELQKADFVADKDPKEVIKCFDIAMKNQYQPEAIVKLEFSDNKRFLVLVDPVFSGMKHRVSPRSMKKQIEAIKILCSPPCTIAHDIDVLFKVHPLSPENELFDIVNSCNSERILPLDSNLHQCLDKVDLIIAVNYIGSALIHAVKAKKPIILFLNDPIVYRRKVYNFIELWEKAGEVVFRSEDLWPCIEKFIFCCDYKRDLMNKSMKFELDFLCSGSASFNSFNEILMSCCHLHNKQSNFKEIT